MYKKGPRDCIQIKSLPPGTKVARIVEDITALLIGLNIRYKIPAGLGIRLTGLPAVD